MNEAAMNKVEEALTAYWGEECAEYEEGCPVCEAWAEWRAFGSEDKTDTQPRKLP